MPTSELIKALGPLASLYADRHVTEIMVDAPNRVLVERDGELEEADIRFDTPAEILRVIDSLLQLCGATLKPGETVADLRFPDSSNRALAVLPPAALTSPTLVIRKWSSSAITWDDLLHWGFFTPDVADLLSQAMASQVSTLVTGGTGSGKTTFANRLAEQIPPDQRLVVVEAVHEMNIRHPRAVFLEAGSPPCIAMPDLLTAASKMRPDWLIVGELIGPEAMRAIELFSRGYTGLTLMHSKDPEDALARLEGLCLMANLGLGLAEIRSLIADSIQLITCQHRLGKTDRRRLTHVTELRGLEDNHYILQPLFRYNEEKDRLTPTGASPSWK